MNLLTAPTDSLYKFLAIGGLIGVVTLAIWATHRIDLLTDKRWELELDVTKTEVEAAASERTISSLEEDLKILESGPHDTAVFDQTLAEFKKVWHERRLRLEEVKIKLKRVREIAAIVQRDYDLARALGAAFIVQSFLGFWWWYLRVQRYQDEILMLQAQAARRSATLPGDAQPATSNSASMPRADS